MAFIGLGSIILADFFDIFIGRPRKFRFLSSDHSTGGKSSGYGAQVKSPSQIVFLFSLVLKVAEKLHFCCFPKGERTIFAWTQDLFSLDGRGDNSKHIHEKKMKKRLHQQKL